PRHDVLPRLWDSYAAMLPALTLPGSLHAALRAFELLVLRQLGHLPDLSLHSTHGQPLEDEVLYTVHPELGVQEAAPDDASVPGWLLRQLELPLRQATGAAFLSGDARLLRDAQGLSGRMVAAEEGTAGEIGRASCRERG